MLYNINRQVTCISCVRQMCCNKLLAFDQGQKTESCKTHLGRLGPEKPLHLEHFVEYISDGYECYVGDPKLLESKDPLLYNYFKRRGLR